ncbi:MAG TPA: hypothetical protein VFK45_00795 [Gammaproteobacteria bacterium]|nr:hypothetical protein [Gammaproteobacteria bacterium]
MLADVRGADVFSVYLSLRDETDERVQAALDDMMERFACEQANDLFKRFGSKVGNAGFAAE